MKTSTDNFLDELLTTQNAQLKKLNKIVSDSIKEEELLVQNLSTGIDEPLNTSERLADKVATFGGSWRFIILFMLLLLVWIILNSVFLMDKAFDPYPFILMNLILSCIAALQAPIIMMSQNRKESKDRKRSENDYLINLKAEIEIRTLHQKINLLMKDELESLFKIQKLQTEMLQRIESKLNSK
ncbi:MAG: DUF1003 domain-containing protein [Bacteroidetes bacterium]|nr:DUF1003 domain-containing protein [Bacteroidota bacterium]MBK9799302.1 DUF1003 domain-containing protein [Bacteroidota bacterium]MBP6411847.1 DUF1003 domain-containing protein [Bacteroidia bacterium]